MAALIVVKYITINMVKGNYKQRQTVATTNNDNDNDNNDNYKQQK